MGRNSDVSIGLPVYNGAQYLEAALDSLLQQQLSELVISDNASTDATQEICERYAAADSRIRYSRNDRNLGWMPNFKRVLELSRGEYFMWASHDDEWSPSYVADLRRGFDHGDRVMLSSGRTVYVNADGSPNAHGTAHAPPSAPVPTEQLVTLLLRQHATSWFYGLYRRTVLLDTIDRLFSYPDWGGDLLFLLHYCLRYDVVGDDNAVIYKRVVRESPFRPQTRWKRIKWQGEYTWRLLQEIAKSPLSLARKATLRDEVQSYLWFMVINQGRHRTARQVVRDVYHFGREWLR
ncbi:MAG TPA: glycosyltransferase family 2 protein [Kofleriaceae bacterium]